MAQTPTKPSDTARAMLTLAATHTDRLVRPPQLPVAAARQLVRSLLNNGLVEEVPAPIEDAAYAWHTDDDGAVSMLRATTAGMTAIGATDATGTVAPAAANDAATDTLEPDTAPTDEATHAAPVAPTRVALRQAAQAALNAWTNKANRGSDFVAALAGPMARLRSALGERMPRLASNTPRAPRENTKQAQVLAMLHREEGATVAQIAETMGWAPHTVRGFFAGLKKRQGIVVEAAERVRQVGPDKQGAKGRYTIYRINQPVAG